MLANAHLQRFLELLESSRRVAGGPFGLAFIDEYAHLSDLEYMVMAYIVMDCIVMAYIVMAYMVMAFTWPTHV